MSSFGGKPIPSTVPPGAPSVAHRPPTVRRIALLPRRHLCTGLLVLGLAASACTAEKAHVPGRTSGDTTVRLGYSPNLTQTTALVGLHEGIFAQALPTGVRLAAVPLATGDAVAQAIRTGSLDLAYLDPNSAFQASLGVPAPKGDRRVSTATILSGAASGGVELVTTPTVAAARDLRGRTIAVERHDTSTDIALRTWLASQDLPIGGTDGVGVISRSGPETLQAFRNADIDGAWVAEPWASALSSVGGRVLVDERTLWPGGTFTSAALVVRRDFLLAHPDLVAAMVKGQVSADDLVHANPGKAQADAATEISSIAGVPVGVEVVRAAWGNMRFGNDPYPSTVREAIDHGRLPGSSATPDLRGLIDVRVLNRVLRKAHRAPVAG
ncbi:MAG: ABC transporter substrate-binding protein [Acidimicrobiales bacterium]